jgi:Arc/MetJ family transcription regulator
MGREINHHFIMALTGAYIECILMHTEYMYRNGDAMRTTINIEDDLIRRAAELTGIREKTSLVKLGLETLIARESSKRLALLGGTEKKLETIPRRRARDN